MKEIDAIFTIVMSYLKKLVLGRCGAVEIHIVLSEHLERYVLFE
jgi:hypothetical protein